MAAKKHNIFGLLLLMGMIFSAMASARPPDEAEFQAAEAIGEDIATWIVDRDPRPASLGLFNVHANFPLEADFASIIEASILKNLAKNDLTKVTSCSECRTAQVSVHEDRVVVSRGATDQETLVKLGSRLPVETLLVVELYRTKLAVIAQAQLFQNGTGTLLGAEKFRANAVSFSDTSVQVLFTFGTGTVLNQAATTGAPSLLATSFNLSLLEEIGFAKAGLNIGYASGNSTTLLHLLPTMSFRGRFGRSSLAYSINLGAGYGFNSDAKGYAFRGAMEVYLGSLTAVGFEANYFIPEVSTVRTYQMFIGGHVGIVFGR